MSYTDHTAVRVALYARVSTADQTCESQLRDLQEYCERRGWNIHDQYVDTGWSGKLASRPELNRLMADARQRRMDAVVVVRLDRWGRSLVHSIQSIQELAALGIRFIAITQNIDTDESNPMSRFMLQIFAAFAELEREMIRERVTAGVRNAKRKGVRLGRKRVVFDRSRAVVMHAAGKSIRDIASTLGIGVGTAHRAIKVFQNPPSKPVLHVDDSSLSAPAVLSIPQSEDCGTEREVMA